MVVPGGEDVIEKQELELCEKEMGCISGERETGDREERDSGIERGLESSRGGSAEGWLSRFNNRVTGRSREVLGSRGQSSDSEASTPDGRRMSIDREGGFGEGNLEQRVRELWVRLAQMETEKLRAVEEAVEAERRLGMEDVQKERIILERERNELAIEKEQIRRERDAIDQNKRMAAERQAREAEMVNRLQVKK